MLRSHDPLIHKNWKTTTAILVCAWLPLCAGMLQPVSPWRWLFSILVPFVLTVRAYKKRSLDLSGALAGECLPANLHQWDTFSSEKVPIKLIILSA